MKIKTANVCFTALHDPRYARTQKRSQEAPHPFGCACWEVRQHEGEGADKHARQLVDDADLLEDGARVVERRQERDVAVAYPRRILDEEVREPVRKGPAQGACRAQLLSLLTAPAMATCAASRTCRAGASRKPEPELVLATSRQRIYVSRTNAYGCICHCPAIVPSVCTTRVRAWLLCHQAGIAGAREASDDALPVDFAELDLVADRGNLPRQRLRLLAIEKDAILTQVFRQAVQVHVWTRDADIVGSLHRRQWLPVVSMRGRCCAAEVLAARKAPPPALGAPCLQQPAALMW